MLILKASVDIYICIYGSINKSKTHTSITHYHKSNDLTHEEKKNGYEVNMCQNVTPA